jgi:hypothetical protein
MVIMVMMSSLEVTDVFAALCGCQVVRELGQCPTEALDVLGLQNSNLQKHYAWIEALALAESDEPWRDGTDDQTLPDVKGIHQRYGAEGRGRRRHHHMSSLSISINTSITTTCRAKLFLFVGAGGSCWSCRRRAMRSSRSAAR